MTMTTLYGIKNCDTVRAARKWLEQHGVDYQFHDVRDQALDRQQLGQWLEALGSDQLLNKRSTTWKQLSETEKQDLSDKAVISLLLAYPTLMKRPLLDTGSELHLGFKANDYQSIFTQHTL